MDSGTTDNRVDRLEYGFTMAKATVLQAFDKNKEDDVEDKPTETTAVVVRDEIPAPVALADVEKRVEYVEQFCNSILKENTDYGVIPGTDKKKKSLLKPGAEKLAFAFHLTPTFTIIESDNDPERDWEYLATAWVDNKKVEVTRRTKGWYRYVVRCDLVFRGTGQVAANFTGACDSNERGREPAPENTIIQMAEKRAMVGAVRIATFTSGRFTQDVEDYQGNQGVQPKGDKPTSGDGEKPQDGGPITMETKYDGICRYCGEKHIKAGDTVHFYPDAGKGQKIGDPACQEKLVAEAETESAGDDKDPRDDDLKYQAALADKIPEAETAAGVDVKSQRSKRGGMDLAKWSTKQLEAYLEVLSK